MKILTIIPARGGSKGIPKKNLTLLDGIPLVSHAVHMAKKISKLSDIFVSTDSPEIASVVQRMEVSVPFMRPSELSGDRVSDFEVIFHGLNAMERYNSLRYDYIIMLQPTSPLRTLEDINACIDLLKSGTADAVWTVTELDVKYHPLKQLFIGDDDNAELFDELGKNVIARQQLKPSYIRNGACYGFSRDCIMKQRTIYGSKLRLITSKKTQISIDTVEDLNAAEIELKKRKYV